LSELEKLKKMSVLRRWLYALKVMSWPKLLIPFIFGQSYGILVSQEVNIFIIFYGLFFTIFLLIYIVLLNDYADIQVDTIKRQLFPNDCSPKTIPDQILNKNEVLRMGILSATLCVLLSLVTEAYLNIPYLTYFSLICIFVFAAYSLPPIRLNYRGGGEFLEMIGVGTMLPTFHYYLHTNVIWDKSFFALISVSTTLALTSALASGMSDEISDRDGGKNTFVTILGNESVRKIIQKLLIFTYLLLLCIFIWRNDEFLFSASVVSIFYYLYQLYYINFWYKSANTNSFNAQKYYKNHLHKLIWGLFLILSISAIVKKYLPSIFSL